MAYNRKILVTGSDGTVGSYIRSVFPQDKLYLTIKKNFDITDKKNVYKTIEKVKPTIVIHLAAKTDVDACEKNQKEANLINTLGTQYIAEACKKINATLVYVSTAAVFNGKKKYYTENDIPNPINIYGKTKLQGEEVIKSLMSDYIIIRAGWIVGGNKKEKKFLSYILKQIKDGENTLSIIDDKFGTLTYGKDLVEFMKFLLEKKDKGIFHFGSIDTCSRYEIAHYFVKLLRKSVKVIPVHSSKFADRFFAPRPKNEILRSVRSPISSFRPWKKILADYVQEELQND